MQSLHVVLFERLVSMEHKCWANAQCSRRKCLELVGIPYSVNDGDLEEKVLKIFEKVALSSEMILRLGIE